MESPAATNYSMEEPGGNISITTTEQEMTDHSVSDQIKLTYEVCKWANGFIILLGLVTNTLIIVVLSRSKIGSKCSMSKQVKITIRALIKVYVRTKVD